jgi:NADH-quinone oxidoreductase subunit N
MALDLITWAPELQLCSALLFILFYGTGPVVNLRTESWWVVFPSKELNGSLAVVSENKTDSQLSTLTANQPDAGPSPVTAHLSIWTVVWCFIGCLTVWFSPLQSVIIGGAFVRDSFSVGISAALLFYASLAILVATNWYSSAKVVHAEYLMLVMLSILGMHLLIYTTDLMSLYLCLELQSFALVVLCSLNVRSAYAVEAGMKYFLLSAFSSCLLLLGIGLVYMDTGLTRIAHLQELFISLSPEYSFSSMLGLWLISLGLLWKLAAAPLHFWAADVYMGAWSSVTLLLSTLPKIAVLAFWMHHWHLLWTTAFAESLFWFSSGSLLIGAIAPLAQVQLKRLLAFSSIGHIGFMLMPLVGGSEGYAALVVYLLFYCSTSLAVWGLLMWPYTRQTAGSQAMNAAGPQYLWDLSGLNLAVPTAATAWAIVMLSLAGLPPAAGFLGKLGLFWWGLNSHQYALVLIALVSTLVSSVYYLRVLKVCYMTTNIQKGWGVFTSFSALTAYVVSVAILVLLLGLWHGAPFVLTAHLLTLSVSKSLKIKSIISWSC